MRISKKDWIFIAIIAGVFAVFFAISGEEKTKRVPLDDKHQARQPAPLPVRALCLRASGDVEAGDCKLRGWNLW